MIFRTVVVLVAICLLSACENRAINEGEEFKPKEIHEKIDYHFDNITVDGVEYLILSRDNNNPHEGFGFMAFRANQLIQKQDSMYAYMRALGQMQALIHSKTHNQPLATSMALLDSLYNEALTSDGELEGVSKKSYSSNPR